MTQILKTNQTLCVLVIFLCTVPFFGLSILALLECKAFPNLLITRVPCKIYLEYYANEPSRPRAPPLILQTHRQMFSQLITAQWHSINLWWGTTQLIALSPFFCGIKFPAAVMEISFVLNLTVNQCDEDEPCVFVHRRFAAFSSRQSRAQRSNGSLQMPPRLLNGSSPCSSRSTV